MEPVVAAPRTDGSVVPATIVASDGFPLAATRFLPADASRGVVLIAPGAWFRQCEYASFARYLARRGLEALTWDWRGIGDSRYEAGTRDRRLSMRAWAWRDYEAMLSWGSTRAVHKPLLLVGIVTIPAAASVRAATTPALSYQCWHKITDPATSCTSCHDSCLGSGYKCCNIISGDG